MVKIKSYSLYHLRSEDESNDKVEPANEIEI